MKNIIILICCIVLPLFYSKIHNPTPRIKTKICINCKHFVSSDNNNEYAKCSLFPRSENEIDALVTGIHKPDDYYYCSTARNSMNMCGLEGKFYKRVKSNINEYKDHEDHEDHEE
jgi:hypothetical protein